MISSDPLFWMGKGVDRTGGAQGLLLLSDGHSHQCSCGPWISASDLISALSLAAL